MLQPCAFISAGTSSLREAAVIMITTMMMRGLTFTMIITMITDRRRPWLPSSR